MHHLTSALLLIYFVNEVATRCDCMNRIILLIDEEDFRIVSSPDYPRYYCPSLECTWRIVGPANTSNIYFYADNLDLRPDMDFIEFYDQQFLMPHEHGSPTLRCTGDETCKFTATDNIMTIRFISGDGNIDHFGFQGTVAGHDRRMRILQAAFSRYSIPVVSCLLVVCALLALVFCCIKRKKASYHEERAIGDDAPQQKLLTP